MFMNAALFHLLLVMLVACSDNESTPQNSFETPVMTKVQNSSYLDFKQQIYTIENDRILTKSAQYLGTLPKTVTADIATRSKGGPHDFFSEGDYWWPDPQNPKGPYIQKDGESNPNNFLAHRQSLMDFSDITATLTSAYLLTLDSKYTEAALKHINAWFVTEETRMNPSLLFGQAISGRYTGRSIGIIDTIHLIEVAKSIEVLADQSQIPSKNLELIKVWFSEYLLWLNTHKYGLKEKNHPNNHGVTWSMQASAFARLVDDQATLSWVRNQFKTVYLEKMMNLQGGFDAELARTKPYGYSLFVIDAAAGVAQLASKNDDNLWQFSLEDGRSMQLGMAFIAPYVADKNTWPFAKDIQYWDNWPVRHISFFFAALAFKEPKYFELYTRYESDPKTYEVIRNLPIRHPLIWLH
jgi:hypothetical protein